MNRREFLQQLSCAMAVAGVASTIPLAVHRKPREVGDTDIRFAYYEGLEMFFQPSATNTGPATIQVNGGQVRTIILNNGWLQRT